MGIRTYSQEIKNGRNPLSLKDDNLTTFNEKDGQIRPEFVVTKNDTNAQNVITSRRKPITSMVESIFKNEQINSNDNNNNNNNSIITVKEFKENHRTWNVNRERAHNGHGIFSQKTPEKRLVVPNARPTITTAAKEHLKEHEDKKIMNIQDLKQLTVQELRIACRERKVNPAGSKDALIERLEEAVKTGLCALDSFYVNSRQTIQNSVAAGVRFDDSNRSRHWNTSNIRQTSTLHQKAMYKGNEIFSSNFIDDTKQMAHTRIVGDANKQTQKDGGGVHLEDFTFPEQQHQQMTTNNNNNNNNNDQVQRVVNNDKEIKTSEARMRYADSARGHDLFGSWTQPVSSPEKQEELKIAAVAEEEEKIEEEEEEEEPIEEENDDDDDDSRDEYKRRQTMSLEEMKLLRQELDEEEEEKEELEYSPAKTEIFSAFKAAKSDRSPVFICPKSPYHAYLNNSDDDDDEDEDEDEIIRKADQAVREAEEELAVEISASLNETSEE